MTDGEMDIDQLTTDKKKRDGRGWTPHHTSETWMVFLLQGFTAQACLHACLSFLSISSIYMEL